MSEVAGVRLRQAGSIYYFDCDNIPVVVNDLVVVETSHGLKLGRVVFTPGQVAPSKVEKIMGSILRKAQPEDIEQMQSLREKEMKAVRKCRELVSQLNLPMKPLSAQSNLEGTHTTIFFSAEQKVDFRELLRKLRRSLKTRVELKQVKARDEAKLIGGIGKCGRPLCCVTFLDNFTPVSIKMAKEQGLSLTPMRISGICGCLMCCLSYESEQYRMIKEKLPKVGQTVITPSGEAKVISINPLKETVIVELPDQTTIEFPAIQVTNKEKKQPPLNDK